MATPNDPDRELRAMLKRLAGDDEKWLLVAAQVVDKAPKMTKDLIREEADDDKARRRVQELIKLQEAAAASARAGQQTKRARLGDTTNTYMRELLQPELEQPPPFTELRVFITSPLKKKLVCQDCDYMVATAQAPLAKELLLPQSEEPTAQTLARVVSCVLRGRLRNVDAENMLHKDVDLLFVEMFGLAEEAGLLVFEYGRNKSDTTSGTTSKLSRPDFLVWVRRALLFKGEEKKNASELGVAESELTTKMTNTWDTKVYGECLYMFAYALGGHMLEIYAIQRGTKQLLLRANMSTLVGKLEALVAVVNMTRALCAMSRRLPAITWGVGQQIIAKDDCNCNVVSTVTNMGDFVRKELMHFETYHSKYATHEFLHSTYAAIARAAAAGHADHLVQAKTLPQVMGSKVVIETAPVGVAYSNTLLPRDEQEAKVAITGAVKGCGELHALGIGHRDPRWPNLIKVNEDGVTRIKIIDYEKSGKLDAECAAPHYPLPHWKYDDGRTVLEPNNTYSAVSDFKMIGKELMARLPCLGDAGQDLRGRLEKGEFRTAAGVLAHEWFK